MARRACAVRTAHRRHLALERLLWQRTHVCNADGETAISVAGLAISISGNCIGIDAHRLVTLEGKGSILGAAHPEPSLLSPSASPVNGTPPQGYCELDLRRVSRPAALVFSLTTGFS